MNRWFLVVTSLIACLAPGALLVGCGDDDDQSDAAAITFGDTVITRSEIDRNLHAKMISRGQDPASFKPPKYTECVRRRTALLSASKPTKGQVLGECVLEYRIAKAEAASLLIRTAWLEREAKRRGIAVSPEQATKLLAKRKRVPEELRNFRILRRSGLTADDILFRVRATRLQRLLELAMPVPESEVRAYLRGHRAEFTDPEIRDVRYVLAKTEGRAAAARDSLARGKGDFVSVVGNSSDAGGPTADPGFRRAVFGAHRKTVVGPVKGALGWYALVVDRVEPEVPASLESNGPSIKNMLRVKRLEELLERRYRPMTQCAPEYRFPELPPCLRPSQR